MPAFRSQIDTFKIPVKSLTPEQASAAPSSPADGQMYYDTGLKRLESFVNGAWTTVDNSDRVVTSRLVSAGTGLTGGGALSADVTLTVAYGTTAGTAAQGNDARLSDSRAPSGAASGDLTGTYPGPTIAALAVTDAKVAAANKDGAAATPSMRTLGTGAAQALAGNTRLDQITAPSAAVAFNGQRATGLADPTSAQDAATKNYVDLAVQGLSAKAAARVGTTVALGNVTLAGGAPSTVDGIALALNDRVVVKNQTTASQNGLYFVQTVGTGANGTWVRALDMDTWAEVPSAFVFIEQGTVNADTSWVVTSDPSGTLNTTAITWVQFGNAAGYTADGTTLTLTGNQFSISATYTGQTSIVTLGTITTGVWNGTTIAIAKGGTGATTALGARTGIGAVGQTTVAIGALTAGTPQTIYTGVGTTFLTNPPVVSIYNVSSGALEFLNVIISSDTAVQVSADVAVASGVLKAAIIGLGI